MNTQQWDSVTQPVEELVWGAREPVETLISTGQLPDHWKNDYLAQLKAAEQILPGNHDWSLRLFWTLHFAACYLPLRWDVWNAVSGQENRETQQALGEISLTTELLFWQTLLESDACVAPDSLTESRRTFFELTLGPACPAGTPLKSRQLQQWYHAFKISLHTVAAEQSDRSIWPAWILVAVHFVSFYIDLHLQRTQPKSTGNQQNPAVDQILARLSRSGIAPAVVSLIDLWLKTRETPRDHSGLPLFGTARERKELSLSPRTFCELFLQKGDGS
ncbi:hypothetical protein Pan153_50070 [Gimesia panareensis]|uniref:Uncharacterized protein n=1 Tax=Gimesia panareensis TaxID=2527978 RepID=A0A518FVF6_9PLAN|nr:hypothetical protein [Gimesia panareensis]QDV20332.1 hypothetical protein Pan153_50070 [Gimesia panareensis]